MHFFQVGITELTPWVTVHVQLCMLINNTDSGPEPHLCDTSVKVNSSKLVELYQRDGLIQSLLKSAKAD